MKILLATRNPGKIRELEGLLQDLQITLVSLQQFPQLPEVEETGESFLENARLKALHYFRHTGIPALADDSGLEVQALGGAPGVYSARLAATDPGRIRRLLQMLQEAGQGDHSPARFVCALCLAGPEGRLEVEETVEGEILTEPRGSEGFGYDPIFYYPPLKKTFAQLSRQEKNRVSHRARALARLRRALLEKENLGGTL